MFLYFFFLLMSRQLNFLVCFFTKTMNFLTLLDLGLHFKMTWCALITPCKQLMERQH